MNVFGYTANDLYVKAIRELQEAPIQEGRGEPTKEIVFASFELAEPRNRLVSIRDINPAFAWIEVLWICAGGNSVKYLEFWNKRMWDFADPETGRLNGAYGARLGFHNLWDEDSDLFLEGPVADALYVYDSRTMYPRCQPYYAWQALTHNPNSRQVTLQIWNSISDLPMFEGQERSKDVPCNLLSHLLLREHAVYGKQLHWMQVMRSNDAVWGWPYNIIQFTFLQEFVAGWLGAKPGKFTLVADSFHTYQKHWANLPKILERYKRLEQEVTPAWPTMHTVRYGLPFEEWKRSMYGMVTAAHHLSVCPLGEEKDYVLSLFNTVDLRFMGLMGMLAAEATRIKGYRHPIEDARKAIMEQAHEIALDLVMANDPYWYHAWLRWAEAKRIGVIL